MWNFILISLHLSKLSERFLFRSLWCVLHEIPGIPARISSFFPLIELQALTSKASNVCRWLLSIFITIMIIITIMNLLWLVRAHIPSPAFALRTHKKSAGAAQIVSIKQIPDQKQKQKKKQKEGKKKKNPPFFFLWRIWGRDLITTAGVCRHWNNNNNNKKHAHTHIHTHKKKNTRRQMNIQSEWQNMRGNNWQMKRRRMCS